MHIAEKEDISRFERFLHHQLRMVVNRKLFRTRSDPLPIQIDACKRAAVVAHDHSVGIEHRDDFKHECRSEVIRLRIVRYQEIDHSLGDVGGLALSGVHAGS